MDDELPEITIFVASVPPLELLPDTTVDKLVSEIGICHLMGTNT
jgi:hypothetical protein